MTAIRGVSDLSSGRHNTAPAAGTTLPAFDFEEPTSAGPVFFHEPHLVVANLSAVLR